MKRSAVLLALVCHPPDQLQHFCSTVGRAVVILLLLIDKYPAKTRDRVAISGFSIGQRYLAVSRHTDIGGSSNAGNARSNEVAGLVLNPGISHIVLDGIGKLNIAN